MVNFSARINKKVLERGNIRLGSVLTDILGKSGRKMLAALAAGTASPEEVADLAQARCERSARRWWRRCKVGRPTTNG